MENGKWKMENEINKYFPFSIFHFPFIKSDLRKIAQNPARALKFRVILCKI